MQSFISNIGNSLSNMFSSPSSQEPEPPSSSAAAAAPAEMPPLVPSTQAPPPATAMNTLCAVAQAAGPGDGATAAAAKAAANVVVEDDEDDDVVMVDANDDGLEYGMSALDEDEFEVKRMMITLPSSVVGAIYESQGRLTLHLVHEFSWLGLQWSVRARHHKGYLCVFLQLDTRPRKRREFGFEFLVCRTGMQAPLRPPSGKRLEHVFTEGSDYGCTKLLPEEWWRNDDVIFMPGRELKLLLNVWLPRMDVPLVCPTYSSREATGYVGIQNQGATCYLSSMLQALFHLTLFRKLVYSLPLGVEAARATALAAEVELHQTENGDKAEGNDNGAFLKSQPVPGVLELETRQNITLALQQLFLELHTLGTAPDTERLTKSFGWTSADAYQQHDVQEFARVLFDALDSCTHGTPLQHELSRLFLGVSENQLKCVNVDFESRTVETFHDLSLQVDGFSSLEESLRAYMEPEMMTGDNQYMSDDHGKQDAEKRTQFLRFPPVLQVHLKRFKLNNKTWTLEKVKDKFEFPLELDVNEFLCRSSPNFARSEQHFGYEYEGAPDDGSTKYVLQSVLVHSGRLQGGHYYAYIRPFDAPVWKDVVSSLNQEQADEANGPVEASQIAEAVERGKRVQRGWLKFDDDNVLEAPKRTAVDRNFEGAASAYMLVYVRASDVMAHVHTLESMSSPPQELVKYFEEERERAARVEDSVRVGYVMESEVFAQPSMLRMGSEVLRWMDGVVRHAYLDKGVLGRDYVAQLLEREGLACQMDCDPEVDEMQLQAWRWGRRSNGTWRPMPLLMTKKRQNRVLRELNVFTHKPVAAVLLRHSNLRERRLMAREDTKFLLFLPKYFDAESQRLWLLPTRVVEANCTPKEFVRLAVQEGKQTVAFMLQQWQAGPSGDADSAPDALDALAKVLDNIDLSRPMRVVEEENADAGEFTDLEFDKPFHSNAITGDIVCFQYADDAAGNGAAPSGKRARSGSDGDDGGGDDDGDSSMSQDLGAHDAASSDAKRHKAAPEDESMSSAGAAAGEAFAAPDWAANVPQYPPVCCTIEMYLNMLVDQERIKLAPLHWRVGGNIDWSHVPSIAVSGTMQWSQVLRLFGAHVHHDGSKLRFRCHSDLRGISRETLYAVDPDRTTVSEQLRSGSAKLLNKKLFFECLPVDLNETRLQQVHEFVFEYRPFSHGNRVLPSVMLSAFVEEQERIYSENKSFLSTRRPEKLCFAKPAITESVREAIVTFHKTAARQMALLTASAPADVEPFDGVCAPDELDFDRLRLVRLRGNSLLPVTECGKPVNDKRTVFTMAIMGSIGRVPLKGRREAKSFLAELEPDSVTQLVRMSEEERRTRHLTLADVWVEDANGVCQAPSFRAVLRHEWNVQQCLEALCERAGLAAQDYSLQWRNLSARDFASPDEHPATKTDKDNDPVSLVLKSKRVAAGRRKAKSNVLKIG